MSSPLRLVLELVLTIALLYLATLLLPQYVQVAGGLAGFIIIGAIFTLLNVIVRPLLKIATLPIKLFMTIVAFIIVNGVIAWIAYEFTGLLDPELARFTVQGGWQGWLLTAILLGLGHWAIRTVVR